MNPIVEPAKLRPPELIIVTDILSLTLENQVQQFTWTSSKISNRGIINTAYFPHFLLLIDTYSIRSFLRGITDKPTEEVIAVVQ
jgi:hypothetical protein